MKNPIDESAAIQQQIISLRNQMADCSTQLMRIQRSRDLEGKFEQMQQLNSKVVAYWTEIQILRERARRLHESREFTRLGQPLR